MRQLRFFFLMFIASWNFENYIRSSDLKMIIDFFFFYLPPLPNYYFAYAPGAVNKVDEPGVLLLGGGGRYGCDEY